MNHLTLTLLLTLAVAALMPGRSDAAGCECDCTAFSEFKAQVIVFERELDQGLSATMRPALQTRLACLQPCAEQWMQCSSVTSTAAANAAETVNLGRPSMEIQVSVSGRDSRRQ